MRQLQGNILNIKSSIIGKITRKTTLPIIPNRLIYLFSEGKSRPFANYSAILSSELEPLNTPLPQIYNVSDADSLCEGDIVLIEPNGVVQVLIEKESNSNCLFLTDRCNCSCVMCPQPRSKAGNNQNDTSFDILALIDRRLKCLGLSGGEPTLLGEKLVDIISYCKKHLPSTRLELLTNGIKLEDLDYVKQLARILHRKLYFEIPLYADTDSLHDQIVGTKGFYKTIKGIYNLALFNQKVNIRIVIHKLNYKRLPYLADFIYHNFPFVYHIAFMQMEIFGVAKDNITELWVDPFDYNEELKDAITYLSLRDMEVSIYNAQLCILPKELRKFARRAISGWKNIYFSECKECLCKNECGGFFASSEDFHSRHILAIKQLDNE